MIRILVADDNPVSRELIREVLDLPGCEVIEACHGQEAIEKIAACTPELVLLDLQMPVLDGFDVLRRVRRDARFARTRILAVTAFAMEDDRQRAMAAGFDGYLTKPIDAASLRRQVQAIVLPQ